MRETSFQNPRRSASPISAPRAHAAEPAPARSAGNVDREFGHARVRLPGSILGSPGEPQDAIAVLDNHSGIAVRATFKQPLQCLGRARLGLEGGNPILDALVVDLRNRGGVAGLRGAGSQDGGQVLSIF